MSLIVPPEWDVPTSKNSHVTEAIISACLEGSLSDFEQLYQRSAPDFVPPASYLVRCAVRSRKLPMLQRILRFYPLGQPWSHGTRPEHVPDRLEDEDRSVHLQYAVFLSIIQGDCALVECLLKAGALLEPCAEDHRYWVINTLLELAILKDQIEVADLLLRRGAKPNRYTGRMPGGINDGVTLAAARGSNDMLKTLLEYRSGKVKDPNILWHMAWHGHSVENAQTLLDLGVVNVNKIFNYQHPGFIDGTALHATASAPVWRYDQSTKFAAWLLEHEIDYTVKDTKGRTATQVAEDKGHTQVKTLIEDWIRDHTKQ